MNKFNSILTVLCFFFLLALQTLQMHKQKEIKVRERAQRGEPWALTPKPHHHHPAISLVAQKSLDILHIRQIAVFIMFASLAVLC